MLNVRLKYKSDLLLQVFSNYKKASNKNINFNISWHQYYVDHSGVYIFQVMYS